MSTPLRTAVVFCPLLLALVDFSTTPAVGQDSQSLVTHGEFTQIYNPSVGEDEEWYINDHCFVFGPDEQWHLFGITHEEPASPADEDNFAHATSDVLLREGWVKHPFALTVAGDAPWREAHLWAPHVIPHDGRYYMYYCAGGADSAHYRIHLATSEDLFSWTRHPANPMLVDGFDARDPFILPDGEGWRMYYTATSDPEGGNHIVACVKSSDLIHWGKRTVVFTDPTVGTWGGPTESPFVVRRGQKYYLFIGPRDGYDGTDVFVSDSPDSWQLEDKVGHIAAHAAEVVRDKDGKWYVSRCGWGRKGVYLAPLQWHDGLDDADTNIVVPK